MSDNRLTLWTTKPKRTIVKFISARCAHNKYTKLRQRGTVVSASGS